MLKADLADAGIPYVDSAERYADFHCLRHTTESLLAASGVHPKVARSIMRHSDINLTMTRYTHTLRERRAKAIEALPKNEILKQKQTKTGTDDVPENLSASFSKNSFKERQNTKKFSKSTNQQKESKNDVTLCEINA
jgi:hypothetical protein